MAVSKAQIVQWLESLADVFAENRTYLTELDSAIGDADHGINMDRGFKKVVERLPPVVNKDIGNILKTTGMTLMSTVGGASGPLYGTFFMRSGTAVADKEELDNNDLVNLFEAGVEGLVKRGRAVLGDKTMVDAWLPTIAAMKEAVAAGKNTDEVLKAAVDAAEQGVQDTIPLQARKGRASYLGERSIGHQDPGATSSWLMLKTLLEIVEGS
ncbi:MAG: dihydroxyacetone kinase subunit DhaL [Candidatus Promineifilaceae bacterium]